MKKILILFLAGNPLVLFAQNVGIGTPAPLSRLHVEQGSVLFKGPTNLPVTAAPVPLSGAGTRLMWYPDKGAFRAGTVGGGAWDSDSIGRYSLAVGLDTRAAGYGSVALGASSTATGASAIAIGISNSASGENSTAIGSNCSATGFFSLAMGSSSSATGQQSISIGRVNKATGVNAVALGALNTSSGSSSVAIGRSCEATGENSFAIGSFISTSGYTGAFALGDASTSTVMESFVANGFRSRFAGGYRLFTNSATTIGAFLNANANSWAALSDIRMKENFLPVDGEAFLKKIAAMPQVSWNYIGQDAKTLRHYGPMAQDFYEAFGRDSIGEIGCDTLINQQDFLGVNLIAIQALEKRTEKIELLEKKAEQQEKKMEKLEKENALLKEQMHALLAAIKAGRGTGKITE